MSKEEEKEKKKNLLDKVKELFAGESVEEVTEEEVSFVDVKTDGGVILRVDDIAVDQPVQEVTEEGLIDVADGTYVLEDGGASLVVSGGIITEVIEAENEEEAEEVVEEEMAEEVEEKVELEEEDPMAKVVEEIKNYIDSKFEAVEKENKELKEKVEKFSSAASESHTDTKTKFKQEKIKNKSPLHVATGY